MDQLLGFNENDMHIGLKLILVLAIFAGLISTSLVLLGLHEVVTHYLPRYALAKYSSLISLLQYLSSFLAFSVIYKFVPHSKVEFRHAMLGGLVAAVLFELAKFGFVIYIRSFGNTQNVLYGSLAAIPIFLFWLYIVSIIFLLGAQIIAVLRQEDTPTLVNID
jgi:membrane protein